MDENIELIRQIRNGDDKAFETLLENHKKMIYKLIYNSTLEAGDYAIDVEEVFQEASVPDESGYSELLERIIKLVNDEKLFLYPNLKVSDLAKQINSNRNYIYHAINVEMGTSFSDYINGLRVDYAARLLEANPDLSINEVIIKSGFTSTSAFYRNFKKFKGITPTEKRTK